jgi:hypothetical protein
MPRGRDNLRACGDGSLAGGHVTPAGGEPARLRRDQEGRLGRREDSGRLLDTRRVGEPAARDLAARRRGDRDLAERLGQHLPGPRQVDGPARLGQGQIERPIDDRLELARLAELIVPLDPLAEPPGLVEGLLSPVDVGVERARERAVLRDGRPARREDHRRPGPRRVHDRPDRVGRPHRHVDHHHLGPSGHRVVAVRHRDRHELVGHQARARRRLPLHRELREAQDAPYPRQPSVRVDDPAVRGVAGRDQRESIHASPMTGTRRFPSSSGSARLAPARVHGFAQASAAQGLWRGAWNASRVRAYRTAWRPKTSTSRS